jgi:deoxyribodipyrimidine photo-lyase
MFKSGMKRYSSSLFIFRRDLRLHDNSGLNQALRSSDKVLPCFVFDPGQIQKHAYQSLPALQFMLQSLDELQGELNHYGGRLAIHHDSPAEAVKLAVREHGIQAVFVNRDYTPFSLKRDFAIAQACQELGVAFYSLTDYLLIEPEQAIRSDGKPYKIFTPFYNNARRFQVAMPESLHSGRFINNRDDSAVQDYPCRFAENKAIQPGGRSKALAILARLDKLEDYSTFRDYPASDSTSRLSPHLKFGTCSVREIYHAIVSELGESHAMVRQLYWRDFYTHIAFHYPYVFGKAFLTRFDAVQWVNDADYFERWRQGNTGFPIVDAGMRELNRSGFMHNRVRMITASFLTKDLHISWRWGERYFAQNLVDYDPCVNNGNWQWAASTGCDPQPYFRIFNPWLQQRKFDPDCIYIKHWLPELRDLPAETIHNWEKQHEAIANYPKPMVNHAEESRIAKEMFKRLAN